MAKEVNKAKEVLEKAEKELKQMVQLNKVGFSWTFSSAVSESFGAPYYRQHLSLPYPSRISRSL
jgi:hypothetical protein